MHRKVTLTSRLSQQSQLHTRGLVSGLCTVSGWWSRTLFLEPGQCTLKWACCHQNFCLFKFFFCRRNKYTSGLWSGQILPEKLGTALGSQISSVLPPKLECVVARKATWNFDLSSLSRTTRRPQDVGLCSSGFSPCVPCSVGKAKKSHWHRREGKEGQGKKTMF